MREQFTQPPSAQTGLPYFFLLMRVTSNKSSHVFFYSPCPHAMFATKIFGNLKAYALKLSDFYLTVYLKIGALRFHKNDKHFTKCPSLEDAEMKICVF